MSSNVAHDTALAFLLAQHVTEQAQAYREKTDSVVVKVTMSPEPRKAKHAKNEAAPIHGKSGTPGMVMPDRGTLDAKGFMMAMRTAGRRINDAGFPYTNQGEVRNDQIKAIHAFFYELRSGVKVHVGYDPTGSFGSQETAARMLAMREIKGAPSVSHVAPSRSVGGYVAGMPDHAARTLANLQGQELREAESKCEYLRTADDTTLSAQERTLAQGLADLQDEKLAHIRAEIARLL